MTSERRAQAAPPRLTGWPARAVWLVVAMLVATELVVALVIPEREALPTWAILVFTGMAASLGFVGALVVTRQPRNGVGWILWLSSLGIAGSTMAGAYANVVVTSTGPMTDAAALVALASQVGVTPAVAGTIILIPLLFPDGRLLGPRWRWLAGYGVVVIVLMVLHNLFAPGPLDDYALIENPLGVPALAAAAPLFELMKGPGVLIAALLAIASAFVRYRRAGAVERTQLRWFGAAVALTISLFALSTLGSEEALDLPALSDFGWLGGIVSLSLIPIAIGIAILRYRLYEIDRMVSRTIGWALVTGLLVAVFALLVVVLQAILAPLMRESTLAVAASTLVAFALFQPLRHRVQRTVDRRFDRARYDGQRMADAFAEHLRNEVDLATIKASLATTADEAVRPTASGVWLRSATAR